MTKATKIKVGATAFIGLLILIPVIVWAYPFTKVLFGLGIAYAVGIFVLIKT